MFAETTPRSPVVLRWRRRRGSSPVVLYAEGDAPRGLRRWMRGARGSAHDAVRSAREALLFDQARDVRAMRVLFGA